VAITLSVDDELKNEYAEVCREMGMSASTAFTVFAKTVVRERRIPFEVSADSERSRTRAFEEVLGDRIMAGYQADRAGQTVSFDALRAEYAKAHPARSAK
jgi:DNA-damage-inducible protein J